MSGQEILGNVAFYVSIAVIIGLALMFAILFAIYGFYKVKHISYGHEDKKLEYSLRKKYKDIIRKRAEEDLKISDVEHFKNANEPDYVMLQDMENVKTFVLVGEKQVEQPSEPTTVLEAIFEEKRKSKKYKVMSNVFFAIFYVVFLCFFAVALTFRLNNQEVYIGDTTLVTVLTGSMETANEENEYLFDEGLTDPEDQITQYSLIGLNRVHEQSEMKLYNIYGFKNNDGVLIIHRLIRIYTNPETGITTYMFRGDANTESLGYELVVDFDQIVGEFNGFENYGLGVLIIYVQSNIGLIAILAAFLFLLSYQITESCIEKAYDKRIQEIAKEIDAKKVILDIRSKKMKKAVEKI